MPSCLRLIYRAWRYRLRDDRAEIRRLLQILRRGDLALDVGCHKGAYLYWMRRKVGHSGRVIAFEPQKSLAEDLRQLIHAAGWRNVTLHNIALSSEDAEAVLTIPGEGGGPSPGATIESREEAGPGGGKVRVRTMRLDSLLPPRRPEPPARLIKCDVEGHELEVFRGAEQLLRREAPALLFECERRHHEGRDMREVFEFLSALKYEGQFFGPGGMLLPLEEFDPDLHQRPGIEPYCNNFFFQRRVPA